METILMSSCLYVAEKFYAQFIKDDIYAPIRNFFFPKDTYRVALQDVIFKTIQQYRKNRPENQGNLPFYLHQEIFEHLTGFILFKSSSKTILDDLVRKNPQVKLPTRDELLDFFNFFIVQVNGNKRLKKTFLDENYQSEIFIISGHLEEITRKLDELLADRELSYSLSMDFYVSRSGEADLSNILIGQNVLLLAGQSFCGKSQLAKMICRDHIRQNYLFLTGDSIELCRQQLLKNQQPTIYLLDDPFGHLYTPESKTAWRRLEQFLELIPKQHKLIVTSRTEVIRQVNQDDALENNAVGPYGWHDLTVKDPAFISRYWSELVVYKNVPQETAALLSQLFEKNYAQESLQPGQLMYLANKPAEQLTGKTVAQLCLTAKADAKGIAVEIVEKGIPYRELYVALGLLCDTIRPVSLETLAFVLSASESLPGFLDEGIRVYSFGNDGAEFPSYPTDGERSFLEALGILQLRGYIKITGKEILFSHPTYRDTAGYLFQIAGPDMDRSLLKLMLRSLACLDVHNVLIAVKQLILIVEQRPMLTAELQGLAVRVAKATLFPAAQSRLTEWLVDGIDQLPADVQEQVMHLAQHITSVSDIFWHEGTPFYSDQGINMGTIFGGDTIEENVFEQLFEQVDARQELSSEQVWEFIEVYRKSIRTRQLSDAGNLWVLSYPEAFIRSQFAAIIFKHKWPAESIIAEILGDPHPEVIVEAVKGCFSGYLTYTAEEKANVRPFITKALNHPAVVIRASNFFCSFGLSHATESIEWYDVARQDAEELWRLWGDLFPLFFEKFPDYLEISNSARFASNLEKAAKYLTPEQGIVVARQFFEWIKHRLKNGHMMDTHELGLVEFLFESNKQSSPERGLLLEQALGHQHTGFSAFTIAQTTWHSQQLSAEEIASIVATLTSPRADGRWLKATIATQRRVLPEFQTAIFGQADFLDQPVPDILKGIDEGLLQDSIYVYTGSPQPLWWYSIHHAEDAIWPAVLKQIMLNERESLLDHCTVEMLGNVLNSPSQEWEDGQDIWKKICAKTIQEDRYAALLIKETAACNFNEDNAVGLWETLIEVYQRKNRLGVLLTMVSAKIEALQQYDKYDVFKIFDSVLNELLDLLPSDKLILLLFQNLKNNTDLKADQISSLVDRILSSEKKYPMRLKLSFSHIKKGIEVYGGQYAVLKKLGQIKNKVDEVRAKQEKDMDDHFKLPNWNG